MLGARPDGVRLLNATPFGAPVSTLPAFDAAAALANCSHAYAVMLSTAAKKRGLRRVDFPPNFALLDLDALPGNIYFADARGPAQAAKARADAPAVYASALFARDGGVDDSGDNGDNGDNSDNSDNADNNDNADNDADNNAADNNAADNNADNDAADNDNDADNDADNNAADNADNNADNDAAGNADNDADAADNAANADNAADKPARTQKSKRREGGAGAPSEARRFSESS